MRRIRWGIGAAAVVLAFVFAMPLLGGGDGGATSGGSPAPGSCARVEGVKEAARYRSADCAADHANVKVAKVVDEASQCPDGAPYTIFTGVNADSGALCLIPNFVEGACYRRDRDSGLRKVDCTTDGAIRVLKVARGVVKCEDGPTISYPEPEVTFCLSRPM